jgi:hypothetical protein
MLKINELRELRQSYEDCLSIGQGNRRCQGAMSETKEQLGFAIAKLNAEICYLNPSSDAFSVRFNRSLRLIGYQISLVVGTLAGMLLMGVAIPVFFVLGAIALVRDK